MHAIPVARPFARARRMPAPKAAPLRPAPVPAPRSSATRALDQLAVAARAGAPAAVDAFLRALTKRLRPFVMRRIHQLGRGVLSVHDTDDVLQEIAIAVWRQDLPRFDPTRGSFATFVSRRLGWHIVDAVRAGRRRPTDSFDEDTTEIADDNGPETLLARAALEASVVELVPQLELALADLPDAERHAVLRHDVEGAGFAEIARELGRGVATAFRTRQRGLLRLSRRLEALAA